MDDSFFWKPPAGSLPIWGDHAPGFREDFGQPAPTLTPYPVQNGKAGGAVVVLPGGGYGIKAAHEAAPIAEWLNGLGIAAFVLDYRVAPYRHPIPMLDARRAIQTVRSRAEDWSVDPRKVAVLGFSAGGHLASTTGTHFEPVEDLPLPDDAVAQHNFRPNALILCYPVISFGPFGHGGSCENLLGPNPGEELCRAFSNETQVTAHTPPTFLWHTANDEAVPVENSLMFAQALSAERIPFALHVFANGTHGLGLAHDHPCAAPWTDLCARWLWERGF